MSKFILPHTTKAPNADLLDGIDSTGFVTNSFVKIKVGSNIVEADNTNDTLELIPGDNINITPDVIGDKLTITNTYTHPNHTGDITGSSVLTINNGVVTTNKIADKNITNVKLSDMPANTIKGTISSGSPIDLTTTQIKSMLSITNVENKSSATIRSELTKSNITTSLGYTPLNKEGDSIVGNLGIGVDNPSDKLEVNGNIKSSGKIESTTISVQNKINMVWNESSKTLDFIFV